VKITEHFYSEEFACKDNTLYPNEWIITRLEPLCDMLERIRIEFAKPIKISSGYRTLNYNRKIGGAQASQHMQGRAADIFIPGVNPSALYNRIKSLHSQGLIILGGIGSYPTFTHIDTRPGNRLSVWTGTRTEN